MTPMQRFLLSKPYGFVTLNDLPHIQALNRLQPLYVRCGGCRFTTAVQYLPTLIEYVEQAGDYVRDVAFLARDVEDAQQAAKALGLVAHPVQPEAVL